jgi:hypothetical protein
VHQLEAFQHLVSVHVARSNPALGQQLIGVAQEIIDVLRGSSSPPHGHVTRVEHLGRGRVRLELAGESTAHQLIEASTNLMDWQPIGVATERTPGMFEFTDPGAAGAPARFYRVRSLAPDDTR